MRPRFASILALLVASGCELFTGTPETPPGAGQAGLNAACAAFTDCRNGLTCNPGTRTCVPRGESIQGSPCTLTAECVSGLFCAAPGVCAPAGTGDVGARCGDASACARGLACVRSGPSLYGACAAPRAAATDGGVPDGGVSVTVGRDVNGVCADTLDCAAGLLCTAGRCRRAAPGEGLPTPWTGEVCEAPAPGEVRALFEIPGADGTPPKDFFRLPFPNDVRRDPTTGRVNLTGFPRPGTALLGFDLVDRYVRALEGSTDGFGTNTVAYFRFSNAINFETLRLDGPSPTVRLIDLTVGAPTNAVRFGANTARTAYLCENHLTVETGVGVPLAPGHTYAALLTDGLRDGAGAPVVADADFRLMLAATAPADPVKARAWSAYAPLRQYLAMNPLGVINAAVWTTQDPTRVVSSLRAAVHAAPAPTASGFVRCAPGVRSPCDDGLTGAAHVRGCVGEDDPAFDELQGLVTIPTFQRGTRPYTTAGEGAIAVDAMGRAMPTGTESVCVTVTVPRGVTMPEGGWPTVLYAHGTGGSYRSVVAEGLSRTLSNIEVPGMDPVRFATVGFEGVMHGRRRGDGVTESPDVLFFNFANPEAARDNVLQGGADVHAMVRALSTVTLADLPATGGRVAFNPRQVVFFGHSQGATVGLPALAYEPDLAGIVLSGAGGDLRASLISKRQPIDIASVVPAVLQEPSVGTNHPALNVLQAFFERSDAANFGGLVLPRRPMGVPARPVLMSYGVEDSYASEATQQVVAGTMGLPVASERPSTAMWPAPSGLSPLPFMNNAFGTTAGVLLGQAPTGRDGHFVIFDVPSIRRRAHHFMATAARGMAVIPN